MNKTVNPNDLTSNDDNGPLYVAQKKVYPQSVSGTFRRVKWGLMAVSYTHLTLPTNREV